MLAGSLRRWVDWGRVRTDSAQSFLDTGLGTRASPFVPRWTASSLDSRWKGEGWVIYRQALILSPARDFRFSPGCATSVFADKLLRHENLHSARRHSKISARGERVGKGSGWCARLSEFIRRISPLPRTRVGGSEHHYRTTAGQAAADCSSGQNGAEGSGHRAESGAG